MYNPFENEKAQYLVLINEEEQCSLWPEAITVPAGWVVCFGPEQKKACQDFIEEHWQDMRPKRLRNMMDEAVVK